MPEPTPARSSLRYADVAVTFTADQFQGIYRGKKYHEPDFPEVLKRAREYGCEKIMLTTMTLAGAHENLKVVRKFPQTCTLTLGVHPYHAREIYAEQDGKEYLQALRTLGKTLLAENPSIAPPLPTEVATRRSGALVGLVHSFAGTKDEMLQLIELGFDISVNWVSFRTEQQLEMVQHIPLDKLQLETDAPWCEVLANDEKIAPYLAAARPLPPSRKHNKFIAGQMVKTRHESCTIERVALVVAGLHGVSLNEVANAAWDNSVRMFGLGVR